MGTNTDDVVLVDKGAGPDAESPQLAASFVGRHSFLPLVCFFFFWFYFDLTLDPPSPPFAQKYTPFDAALLASLAVKKFLSFYHLSISRVLNLYHIAFFWQIMVGWYHTVAVGHFDPLLLRPVFWLGAICGVWVCPVSIIFFNLGYFIFYLLSFTFFFFCVFNLDLFVPFLFLQAKRCLNSMYVELQQTIQQRNAVHAVSWLLRGSYHRPRAVQWQPRVHRQLVSNARIFH